MPRGRKFPSREEVARVYREYIRHSDRSPEDEAAFNSYIREISFPAIIVFVTIVAALVLISWPMDYFIYRNDPRISRIVVMWRLFLLAPFIFCFGPLVLFRSLRRWIFLVTTICLSLVYAGTGYCFATLGGLDTNWFYAFYGYPFFTILISVDITRRIPAIIAVTASALCGYFLPFPQYLSYPYITSVLIVLGCSAAVSLMLGHIFYHQIRTNFFTRQALERAYNDLNEAKDELVRKESLASVGTLVAGAAHELNNPIGSAYSLIQSIEDDLLDGAGPGALEEVLSDIRAVKAEQRRAAEIVARLLEVSELSATHVEIIDLCVIAADASNRAEKRHGVLNGRIRVSRPPFAIKVRGSWAILSSVLDHLMYNAALALSYKKDGSVKIEAGTSGGTAYLKIEDTGCGMENETLASACRPFFTSWPGSPRVGLGLYFCQEAMSRHRGELKITSREGTGTELTLTFGLYRQDPVAR